MNDLPGIMTAIGNLDHDDYFPREDLSLERAIKVFLKDDKSSEISADFLTSLKAICEWERWRPGAVIHNLGHPASVVRILTRGSVGFYPADNDEAVAAISSEDEFPTVGAEAIAGLDDIYLATAIAQSDAITLALDAHEFLRLLEATAELRQDVVGQAQTRTRQWISLLTEALMRQKKLTRFIRNDLEQRANLAQLVAIFVSTLSRVEPENVEEILDESLEILSTHFEANQILIYRFDARQECLRKVAGWHSPSLSRPPVSPLSISVSSMPYVWTALRSFEAVVVSSLDDLPDMAESERLRLASEGVCSFIKVPMVYRGKVDGLLALDSVGVRRIWPSGSVTLLKVIAEIISNALSRRETDQKLYSLAHYDTLTGLSNRLLFRTRLADAMARAQASGGQVTLLYLDVDNFKRINDSLGHGAGDLLLRGIGQRLNKAVRQSDVVARLGGDEFAILVEGRLDQAGLASFATKLLAAMAPPMHIDGQEIFVSISIGLATYPTSTDDIDELIKFADMAMYSAKKDGRNRFSFYSDKLNTAAGARIALESDLNYALERGEMEMHCQPQIWLENGALLGAEALIRWRRPRLGMAMPSEFLPVAESSNLIVDLSEWILSRACRNRLQWPPEMLHSRISINVSSRWLRHDRFVSSIFACLDRTGLDPAHLEIELTEEILLIDLEENIDRLKDLRSAGISIALDDFGIGCSSLTYLRNLPIDIVKIDQSFVRNLTSDTKDFAIVNAIVRLAHDLGLKVVAEGVETEGQRALLADIDCDAVQGFLISRAKTEQDFMNWLVDCSPSAPTLQIHGAA